MTGPDKQPDPLKPDEDTEVVEVTEVVSPVTPRGAVLDSAPDWVQSMTQPGSPANSSGNEPTPSPSYPTPLGFNPPSGPSTGPLSSGAQPGKMTEAERAASSLATDPLPGTSLPGAQPGRVNPNQPDFSPTVPASPEVQPGFGSPSLGGQPTPEQTPGWGSGAGWNVGNNPTTPQTPPAPGSFTPYAPAAPGSKKIAAGLLAIFLGSLGVHKFYLGMNTPGFILLGATLFGAIFFWLIFPIIFIWAAGIVGLIEGIIYLTKTDQQFYQEYEIGKKQWF